MNVPATRAVMTKRVLNRPPLCVRLIELIVVIRAMFPVLQIGSPAPALSAGRILHMACAGPGLSVGSMNTKLQRHRPLTTVYVLC